MQEQKDIAVVKVQNTRVKMKETSEKVRETPGKLKQLFLKYQWSFLITYASVYVSTIGLMYTAVSNGVDVKSIMEKIPYLHKLVNLDSLNPKTGSLVAAFLATKFTSPIRFAIVVSLTPTIHKLLRRFRR